MNQVILTPNFEKLVAASERGGSFYKVLEGSSGSGKTFAVIQYLIRKALSRKRRITAFRHDQATCRDSIIADFKRVMIEQFGIWDDGAWNSKNFDYTFSNGSVFQFRGSSNAAKLHGPRRDIAWENEVMEIHYDAHRQIAMRTAEEVVMDFNPSFTTHWVFDRILPREDAVYIHSTFRDNPMLPEAARQEILSLEPTEENRKQGTADEWAWQVYGLGKRGRREGAIFRAVNKTPDWPHRMLCEVSAYGVDFGFSNDPTAIAEIALFQGNLYLREHLYEKGLVAVEDGGSPDVASIEGRILDAGLSEEMRYHCDSARPEIIAALRHRGIRAVPVRKTKDSIVSGLDRMKSFPLYVHEDSHNLLMEFEQYAWAKTGTGMWLSRPEDKNNHLIDAARYAVLNEIGAKTRGFVGRAKGGPKSVVAPGNMLTWN